MTPQNESQSMNGEICVNGDSSNLNIEKTCYANSDPIGIDHDDDLPWSERIQLNEAENSSGPTNTNEIHVNQEQTHEQEVKPEISDRGNEAQYDEATSNSGNHESCSESTNINNGEAISKSTKTKNKENIVTSNSEHMTVDVKNEVKTPEPEPTTTAKKKNKHKTKDQPTANTTNLKRANKRTKETTPEQPAPKNQHKVKIKEEAPESPNKGKKRKTRSEDDTQEVEPTTSSPRKRKKADEEGDDVWKWWEEEKKEEGVKWRTLEHKGPLFAPPYIPLPSHVKFKYDGEEMELFEPAEEVASFYAKMLDHEYTSKQIFNKNFLHDWRKVMTSAEKAKIKDLSKCDFKAMAEYYKAETEKRKARSKEEKKAETEVKKKEAAEYGVAYVDGHKQAIGNFRIEPPGLFRGRGDHPKMGSLKKRIMPEDVIINCSKGSKVPVPPPTRKWHSIQHDNTVTWLASWTEIVTGSNKYIMLNPSSKLKGEKDWEKFETARRLKSFVSEIRENYTKDFKSHEMRVRQRAVALYFIDKLALRAGNEKDTEEAADTVGCCSLRCEHIKLFDESDGSKNVVEFDFLGKDSIRYYNRVPVEKSVFKNLKKFVEGKNPGDDLFDRLDTSTLNDHLRNLMPGLTAKVFRTYNASITLQDQLEKLTKPGDNVHEKFLSYNRANRQVAILCNHQRAIPKTHEKSMENLQNKIKEKKKEFKAAKAELKSAKGKDIEKVQKKVARLKDQVKKLKLQRTDRDENKQIALGTSKLNYLDPRISVAWCKRNEVAIEKIFSKTQREKFRWAIDMASEDYVF